MWVVKSFFEEKMKTVNERLKSSGKNKTPFAWGYKWGVQTYRKYPHAKQAEREKLSAKIQEYKEEIRDGAGRSRECAIGFMNGMRDAAVERKRRRKP